LRSSQTIRSTFGFFADAFAACDAASGVNSKAVRV